MKKRIVLLTFLLIGISFLFADETNDYQVGSNELFIMPTAYTMPEGRFYFADYELVFINLTTSLTNRTMIGFYTLFPIHSSFMETLTISGKQNWLKSDAINSAIWLTYTPKAKLMVIGNVLSIGREKGTNAHIGISNAFEFNSSNSEIIFMGGAKHPVSRVTSFMVEIFNTESLVKNDFNGLLNIGLRFQSNRFAIDIAGMRPLENTGELLFIPFLKVVIMLN